MNQLQLRVAQTLHVKDSFHGDGVAVRGVGRTEHVVVIVASNPSNDED